MKKYILPILGILLLLNNSMIAQNTTSVDTLSIKALAQPYGDSIAIRWAPTSKAAWEIGNKMGYELSRVTTKKNGIDLNASERQATFQTLGIFKLWEMNNWKALTEKDDMAFLAAGLIYGELDGVEAPSASTDIEAIIAQKKVGKMKFAYCLHAADQSMPTAKALGLAYVDKTVVQGDAYTYIVKFVDQTDTLNAYRSGLTSVYKNIARTLPAPPKPNAVFNDKAALMSWSNDYTEKFYSGFDIERSEDGGNTFEKVNKVAVIPNYFNPNKKTVAYIDSLAENGKLYVYRTRGRTPFGDYSPPSDTIQGMGQMPGLMISPQIVNLTEFPKGQVQLTWEFDESAEAEIQGFNIYRKRSQKDSWELVSQEMLAPNIRKYTDATPWITAYYQVVVIDNQGYKENSLAVLSQLEDLVPPAAPIKIKGTLVPETGEVTLIWQANTEADLKGYKVFFSNQKEGNYAQITTQATKDTTYTHTITMNTSTEKVYFKVLALDFRQNFSEFSDVFTITRPDKLPPSPPLVKGMKQTELFIKIEWVASSSDDVVQHKVMRRTLGTPDWSSLHTLDTLTDFTNIWRDSTATYNQEYEYKIVAMDDADLTSESAIVRAKLIDKGIRLPVEDFAVIALDKGKQLNLTWQYSKDFEIKQFKLYRAVGKDKMTTYKLLKPQEVKQNITTDPRFYNFEFVDKKVSKGKTYRYKIIAIHEESGRSPLTNEIAIKIE